MFFPRMTSYYADVITGVLDHARQRVDWNTRLGVVSDNFAAMLDWRPHGIIGIFDRPAHARTAARHAPVITVSGRSPRRGIAAVHPDDRHAGRLAAEHLLSIGMRRFAYCAVGRRQFSNRRLQGFREALAREDYQPRVFRFVDDLNPFRVWVDRRGRPIAHALNDWLKSLDQPVGLMCANDRVAVLVSQACGDLGIAIPHQVALVGVDDDPMLCQTSSPPLTSVALTPVQIGRRAAALLDDLMVGRPRPAQSIELPPSRVVERASTGGLPAGAPPELARAVRFIRDRADRPTRVADVVDAISVNRRSLEKMFIEHLDRTPLQEIRRVHVARAQELLMETGLPISGVAHASGFASSSVFATLFRRATGMTPGAFRRRNSG